MRVAHSLFAIKREYPAIEFENAILDDRQSAYWNVTPAPQDNA